MTEKEFIFPPDVKARYRSLLMSCNSRSIPWALEREEFAEVLARPCAYCGRRKDIDVDMRNPVHVSGFCPLNIEAICKECKKMKGGQSRKRFLRLLNHVVAYTNEEHGEEERTVGVGDALSSVAADAVTLRTKMKESDTRPLPGSPGYKPTPGPIFKDYARTKVDLEPSPYLGYARIGEKSKVSVETDGRGMFYVDTEASTLDALKKTIEALDIPFKKEKPDTEYLKSKRPVDYEKKKKFTGKITTISTRMHADDLSASLKEADFYMSLHTSDPSVEPEPKDESPPEDEVALDLSGGDMDDEIPVEPAYCRIWRSAIEGGYDPHIYDYLDYDGMIRTYEMTMDKKVRDEFWAWLRAERQRAR